MLSERAVDVVNNTKSSSMVLNLKKWLEVSDAYAKGGFMYYTTMPTDAIQLFRNVAMETKEYGFDKVKSDFVTLGEETRAMMESKGFKLVADKKYAAPGVIVAYTQDSQMLAKFKQQAMQVAAGVPWMLGTSYSP